MTVIPWGPSGKDIYERTYSRTKADGASETWPETVERVVDGNLALADERHLFPTERQDLIDYITAFKIIPAGRHLWASGVKGRQYLFNCHVAGWGEQVSEHFAFTFMRLMEGGGVGANYSNKYLADYATVRDSYDVHVVCDEEHADYAALSDAGLLSSEYSADWPGGWQVEDSREGWSDALVELIDTYYRSDVKHHARVFNVSRVRPQGAKLRQFGGHASGPVPLAKMLHDVADVLNMAKDTRLTGIDAMEIDHAIAQCVVAGGVRRSARMSIMHWDDPQIYEFLHCKGGASWHWTTNISVEVDSDFWKEQNRPGRAAMILSGIAYGMVRNGEPGFWDSTRSNYGEPNPVICTNPCGEIALESWENCNLGHVNLAAFVDEYGNVDEASLEYAHVLMTRFLIRATYGDVTDDKQAAVLARNRRIGVGHFGVASFLALRGISYADAPFDDDFQWYLRVLSETVKGAAVEYAHDLRIPVPVKTRTVAPTGTIAKLPGVSEGIHPIYGKYFIRRIRFSTIDPAQVAQLESYRQQGYHVEPCQYAENTMVVAIPTKDSLLAAVEERYGDEAAGKIVQSADDLTLDEMLAFQAMYQECWADNAVSYTANIDPAQYSVDDIADSLKAVAGKVKGATVFPDLSRPQSPYERITEEEYEQATAKAVADSTDADCSSGACPIK